MSNTEKKAIGDMKAASTIASGARPQLSILPQTGMVYASRPIEYGGDKYARGNYYGPASTVTPIKRFLGYLDAALRHIVATQDAINRALGTGGDLAAACAAPDDVASGGFPPSGLPHVAHAISSLMIGVTGAADDGLLPADPGQPWKAALIEPGLPQKDDPAAERRRVERRAIRYVVMPRPAVPAGARASGFSVESAAQRYADGFNGERGESAGYEFVSDFFHDNTGEPCYEWAVVDTRAEVRP